MAAAASARIGASAGGLLVLGVIAATTGAGDPEAGPSARGPEPPEAVTARLDALLAARWKAAGVAPVDAATDAEFLRRLSLDLRGTLPEPDEVRAYLSDPSPDKRRQKTLAYIESPEQADYFARLFTDVLLGSDRLTAVRYLVFQQWLERRIHARSPWNEIARELLMTQAPRSWSGPANFLLRWSESPEVMATMTSRLLLGVQIQCAQCHDHGGWTQSDYNGFAAFFARIRRLPIRQSSGIDRDYYCPEFTVGEMIARDAAGRESPVTPRFLKGRLVPDREGSSRRRDVTDILASRDNPFLSLALVNRLAGHLFGRGFVEPVDDIPPDEPLPAELALLAADCVDHGYDMRRTLLILTGTRAYALSSRCPDREDRALREEHFACARLRPLDPHQLVGAVFAALDERDAVDAPPPGPPVASEVPNVPIEPHDGRRGPSVVGPDRSPTSAAAATPAIATMDDGMSLDATSAAAAAPLMNSPGRSVADQATADFLALPIGTPLSEPDPMGSSPEERRRAEVTARIMAVRAGEPAGSAFQGSVAEMLFLMNGELFGGSPAPEPPAADTDTDTSSGEPLDTEGRPPHSPRRIESVAALGRTLGSAVDELFLASLSRPPTRTERAEALVWMAAGSDRRQVCADLLWALLNSAEFLFNH